MEYQYAALCPADFAAIVTRYGHTTIAPKKYTASAFLAGVLGVLSRQGTLLYHFGPATGHWSYNGTISWWSLRPELDWGRSRLAWADIGHGMSYVPGSIRI